MATPIFYKKFKKKLGDDIITTLKGIGYVFVMKKLIKSFVVASLFTSVVLFAYNPLDGVKAQKIAASNLIKIQRGKIYTLVKKGILKPENHYVVYCRTKHRATLSAATLIKYFKFENVTVLDGGIKAWIQSGGDINNSLHLGTVKITLNK
jgi:rhodanese-related sulfurtransferase